MAGLHAARARWLPSARPSFSASLLRCQAHTYSSGVQDIIEFWGRQQSTAVTLQDICECGLNRKRRRKHGEFLHEELRIRFAQRVLELQQLPYGLPAREGIQTVIEWYTDHLLALEDAPLPTT